MLACPRCRDSQKLAKMAIYSLHRGDFVKADQQLQQTGEGKQMMGTLGDGAHCNALVPLARQYARVNLHCSTGALPT